MQTHLLIFKSSLKCHTYLCPSCCWLKPAHWTWNSWAGLSVRALRQQHCEYQPLHKGAGSMTWLQAPPQRPGSTETCTNTPPALSGPVGRSGGHFQGWQTPAKGMQLQHCKVSKMHKSGVVLLGQWPWPELLISKIVTWHSGLISDGTNHTNFLWMFLLQCPPANCGNTVRNVCD